MKRIGPGRGSSEVAEARVYGKGIDDIPDDYFAYMVLGRDRERIKHLASSPWSFSLVLIYRLKWLLCTYVTHGHENAFKRNL
jgi:hypothetical protein